MYKICVCGAFNFGAPNGGGQLIKTRILANELEKKYGSVYCIDACGKLGKILLIPQIIFSLCICKNIVILPAHHAVVLESQLLRWCNLFFHRRLIYVVIGGWLQDFLPSHRCTAKALHHFHGIYVETSTMQKALQAMGYENVKILPNFKDLLLIPLSEIKKDFIEPLPLAMMARVTEKKGTGDAVRIVNEINAKCGREVYSLDIYGPIDKEDKEWFDEVRRTFSNVIRYKGVVPYDKTVETLKSYYALLFPTKYYTEGIPGTIIDSYAAGVPVVSSRWKSFEDVVDEGKTGVGYEFDNVMELKNLLMTISENPQKLLDMRCNCIEKAKYFTPATCVNILDFK